jgi:hypothetical protein
MVDNMGAPYGRLPDEAMRARMIGVRRRTPRGATPAPTHAVQLPAAVLDRYVGEYEFPTGMTLNVRREGAGLAAAPGGQQEVALSTLSETRFSFPGGPRSSSSSSTARAR